jgi:hypothetical protein
MKYETHGGNDEETAGLADEITKYNWQRFTAITTFCKILLNVQKRIRI